MTTDDVLTRHGAHVLEFARAVPNLGRLNHLSLEVLKIFKSKDWRAYRHGLGVFQFLPGEFDYFLAMQGVDAQDVVRLNLTPEDRVALAGAMDRGRENGRYRRTVEAVVAAHPHAAKFFRDRWESYHWGVRAPIGNRALHRARTGVTFEAQSEKARAARLRAHRNGWRGRVDQIVERVRDFDRDELFALIVALKQLASSRPSGTVAQWQRDADTLKWSAAACAKRWRVPEETARKRLGRLKSRE